MKDICERLRAGHQYSGIVDPLDIEAAAEIERLTESHAELEAIGKRMIAEIDRLRAALKPFSEMAGELFARNWNNDGVVVALDNPGDSHRLTARDFFAARMALTHEQSGQEK